MTNSISQVDPLSLGSDADLETVLSAWYTATVQLERTHEALREEVKRLTGELEVKNRELARKDRLADLGRMASHIAHEVRNNLVPVTLYLSLLRRRVADDCSCGEILDKVEAGFTALDVTVHDLLHFTADRDPRREMFLVSELIEEVVESLAPQFSAQSIDATHTVDSELTVWADRDMLRRAILNLTLNAIDIMPEGGRLEVCAVERETGIEIEVADTGPGLSDEVAGKLFDPFFTTKSSGTGLGLAIVARIVEVHGGQIVVSNRPEGGAVFTLQLPSVVSKESAA